MSETSYRAQRERNVGGEMLPLQPVDAGLATQSAQLEQNAAQQVGRRQQQSGDDVER